jgi:hypothetical protein
MVSLARLPRIAQTARYAGDQCVATLGCLQQQSSTIEGALPLIEFHLYELGKDHWKQQTLCCAILGQAKALSYHPNTVLSTYL